MAKTHLGASRRRWSTSNGAPAAMEALEPRLLLSAAEHFDIGSPVLADLYVDPVGGSDAANGLSRQTAFRTLRAAWDHAADLSATGWRINLLPGAYPFEEGRSNYYAGRAGTAEHPVIITAADGAGTVTIRGGLNLANVSHVYLIDVDLAAGLANQTFGNDVLHLDGCSYMLMRGMTISGPSHAAYPDNYEIQEVLKANQCDHLYLEDSDLSGTYQTGLDYVSVQYGHIMDTRIHDAGEWAGYFKGGSAYLRVEGNDFDTCGLGFQAGEGTNFAVMRGPWLHYETYDIKVVNNVFHDIVGTGFSAAGSYNLLLAYNTFYNVATDADPGHSILQFTHGRRGCSRTDAIQQPEVICQANLAAGGWGTDVLNEEFEAIPNRNVYVYDNILYNPSPGHTLYASLGFQEPANPPGRTNIPSPSYADDNVVLRGNILWNGPADMPLGLDNSRLEEAQVRSDNAVNTVEPALIDPAHGNFRPVAGGNVFTTATYAVPNFSWADAPTRPAIPAGTLSNAVWGDYQGTDRAGSGPAGAFASSTPGPQAAPTAHLSVPDITASGGLNLDLNVQYADDTAVDVSTLDGSDIVVSGPGGQTWPAAYVGVDTATDGAPRVATYRIQAPGGVWSRADNGAYSVAIQANQVADTDGAFVAAGQIAAFTVNIASDVLGRFGSVDGRAGVRLPLTDADGTAATFALTGPGTGQVTAGDAGWELTVTGTDARSAVTVTTRKTPAAGDNGEIDLHLVTVGDPNTPTDRTAVRALIAATTNLLGDLTVTGALGALTLDDVSGSTITVGPPAEADTRTATTYVMDQVAEAAIDSGTPIASLTVTEWLDGSAPADRIAAPWIGRLVTKGRRYNPRGGLAALAGNFQAGLLLPGVPGSAKPALAAVTIAGALSAADWDIAGKVGMIAVAGNVDGWSLHSTAGLLAGVTSVTLAGGTASTVAIDGPLATLRARRWTGGSISATAITSLTTTADRTGPLDGSFSADVTLAGIAGSPLKSLATTSIGGAITGGTWDITGPAGAITAKSAAAAWTATVRGQAGTIATLTLSNAAATSGGHITAWSIGTVNVPGNLSEAHFVLSQPVDARRKALGSFTVGGAMDDSEVIARGNIGAVTLKTLARSRIFASVIDSVVAGVLPALPAEFDSGDASLLATIASVRILGVRAPAGGAAVPSLVNSGIAAGSIGMLSLTGPVADQDDEGGPVAESFGFATRTATRTYRGPAGGSVSDFVVRVI